MNELVIREDKEYILPDGNKIILSKENENLSLIIKKSNSICAIVFDSSKKNIFELSKINYKTTSDAISYLITKTSELLNVKNLKDLEDIIYISSGIIEEYPNFKIEDIQKCFQMGRRGQLYNDKGEVIDVFGSLNEKIIFQWLKSYEKIRNLEISKIRIEESKIYRDKLIEEPLAKDEVWEKFSKERKNKLKEEGRIIMPSKEFYKKKKSLFSDLIDKRKNEK